ncbi:cytochrome o ubiquinol oxidase subunit III [Candidatus Saccharibacteria bacterium RIFCSPHIGHO2_01_FULL_45_15]|nr:MAG: cytochrome o ubiquinol oxidase subunit III [Candidatus Saccharibacteria bacterium RIFCSPHIGHO2_01_FULL_45_15]OGL27768.1 MAG: cytochrome o ubiquinol oxidase subunit III [Candidatus Saccharibacteria bacterium RIFCSPHIGHO2_02_FULL_46_12]OGL31657.1 MAG: cytochrome o ubiquinol oxidase subunit III [Candidatus Saccharibacteria bacterium RIFCSPHIGHO2_12_FULL_44_22]
MVLSHARERIESDIKVTLGFWLYLMTDCILFATLFAVYVVMQPATAGGPSGAELFDLPFVLGETLLLLFSSFTCGLALLAARARSKNQTIAWLLVTVGLGCAFLSMELYEFIHLINEGFGWQRSGFLSAFFVLVGTHGLHILVGILWAVTMIVRLSREGLTHSTNRKLTLFSMFWHFLDVIWIFIFTIVYMIGAIS